MNIGFIAPQIALRKGGIEATSFLLADYFSQKVSFRAFCANDSDEINRKEDVRLSKYRKNQTIRLHISLIVMVIRESRIRPFDFTFTSLFAYGIPCLILKKTRGTPYGVMIHGNDVMTASCHRGIFRIKDKIKNAVRTMVFNDADIVFSNSNYTRDLFVNRFGEKRIVVIHPPIMYEEKKIRENTHDKKYMLLSIGRLVERKGFQYVIEAIKTIKTFLPEIKYFIAGSGPFLNELQNLVKKLGLMNTVVFCGNVSEDEKEKLYLECDYFVMPSYTIEERAEVEGFGIVYIEANMYGKYVLSTRSGGTSDAILEGITGEFVEPQNVNALIEKIKKLYGEGFNYYPRRCIDWSKKMDISCIGSQYLLEINRCVGL